MRTPAQAYIRARWRPTCHPTADLHVAIGTSSGISASFGLKNILSAHASHADSETLVQDSNGKPSYSRAGLLAVARNVNRPTPKSIIIQSQPPKAMAAGSSNTAVAYTL